MMKIDQKKLQKNTMAAAVACALAASYGAAVNAEEFDYNWKNEQQISYSSVLELGLESLSEDSIKFGEYNGRDENGTEIIANAWISARGDYDGDSARYWTLSVEDLGAENRALRAVYGDQGNYKAWIDYRESYKIEWLADNASTAFAPAGAANILEDSGVATPLDLSYERDNFGLGFSWNFASNWTLATELQRENKEGVRSTGVFPSNPNLAPSPIDYREDKLNVSLAYNTARYNSKLSYEKSEFDNKWLDVQISSAQLDLAPDSSYEQLAWAGALRFGKTSRVAVSLSQATLEQDADFLPFSTNPLFNQPLPRTSLDGELEVTHANIQYTVRPLPKLNLLLSYTLDERDSKTPQAVYSYSGWDSSSIRESRINTPYEFDSEKWQVEAGYRLNAQHKLSLGLESKTLERSEFSEADENTDDTVWAQWRWQPSALFSASLKASISERDSASYVWDSQYYASRDFSGTTRSNGRDPDMRQFNKTDRDRERWVFNASLMPTDALSINLTVDRASDEFDQSTLASIDPAATSAGNDYGLKQRDIDNYNIDLHYQPSSAFNLYAYLSRNRIDTEQNGGRDWFLDISDNADMVGAGFEWEVLYNRLDINVDISQIDAQESFRFAPFEDSSDNSLPYKSRRWDVTLDAEYRFQVDLSAKLEYAFMSYESRDYALDNGVGSGFGSESPDDTVHAIKLTVIKRF